MNSGTKIILLAEDDENDAFFMEHALQRAQITLPLHIVEDGEEAIQYLDGRGKFSDRSVFPFPHVVFLDLKLPYLNGFEILEHIRRQESLIRLQVFILTSSSEERDRQRASELGANGYFVKPPNAAMLLEVFKDIGVME